VSVSCDLSALQSVEELERLTVDERLEPVDRAVYLLRSASSLQLLSNPTCLRALHFVYFAA